MAGPPARACSLSAKGRARGSALISARPTRAQRGARVVSARAALSIHTVQKGESLWSISQKNGTTLEELKRVNYNSLGNEETIYPGQQLVIPSSASTPAFSTKSKPYAPANTSKYNSYSTSSAAYYAPPAQKKGGLGLVTAGAFFIALAVGIYIFKQDEYKTAGSGSRGGYGGYGDRRRF